jgi:hypothetical protein
MPSFRSLITLACAAGTASAAYTIQDTYDTSNFFSRFNFFSGSDPTHGFVAYADAGTANNTALAGYSSNAVYLGVDHTTVNPSGGRASVRLESQKQYTRGLFIADIAHMPSSECGVWPAFWTFGPDWPSSGEIDIIEGVNTQSTNAMTLHTAAGCSMSNPRSMAGSVLKVANCNSGGGNEGCSQTSSDAANYGTGFNAGGGGVYAMEWTSHAINIYFFPRSAIPADITSGSPNPSSWGPAQANFAGQGCNIDDHFKNHNIIFDTTFCGDWAGRVWGDSCAAKAPTCEAYVGQNPAAFAEAYWLINSVKVYSQGAAKRDVVATPFLA